MANGTIRYWAAAKDAADTAEESFSADNLAEVLEAVRAVRPHNGVLHRVLERSSFLVDGNPVGKRTHDQVELDEGSVIEVLPPFAGG